MINLYEYIFQNYREYFLDENLKIIQEANLSLLDSCALAVGIYRIQKKIFLNIYEKELEILAMIQKQYCGCEIYYSSNIGKNFILVHGLGTIIGSNIKIGDNCTIFQNVTLGKKHASDKNILKIGDNVVIYAGAKVLGNLTIGSNVVIGANSLVLEDIPDNEVWGGIPAKKVGNIDFNKHKIPGR